MNPKLPSHQLTQLQNEWLRGARSRLLRRANIASKTFVVDLGAGWGDTVNELSRRSIGQVLAIDENADAVQWINQSYGVEHETRGIRAVQASADALPIEDATVDLVFSQCAFLWIKDVTAVIQEIARILVQRGAVVALEPDFGGMMVDPVDSPLQDLWINVLANSGADPFVGRTLPRILKNSGLRVEVRFFDRLESWNELSIQSLLELPLTPDQRSQLSEIERTAKSTTVHLPYWLVYAEISGSLANCFLQNLR